jgi:ferredoxin-NADP reductase
MSRYEARLTRSETVAEETQAFHITRPRGFEYRAGQSMLVALNGATHVFSIASAPHEAELMFATRMRRTDYKRALARAGNSARLRIDGPHGVMTLHDDARRPAVFLAGGVGITPFLSMARHAAHARLPHHIFLFYSNRRPQDAPFLDELAALQRANPAFRLIATVTQADAAQNWSGEIGPIGRNLLERHLGDLTSPLYYYAGPPGLAMAMQSMLGALGVREDDMRSEEFYGY